ncbi:substrate-binding periplasmic protein [Pseudoduganella sp. OTU4001]|uniref:substrate-binding periplasmic protein n=1 Tax=Pseudoduganella sp. OTU4001 TaxID=3043854 RepID=UPI00313CE902
MRRKSSLLVLSLALPVPLLARPAPELAVVYPGPRSDNDKRAGYYHRLLRMALEQSGARFTLRANPMPMVGARVVQEMTGGQGINITWLPTSRELERLLIPVRVPLDKGILGWRVFLIRKDDQARFSAIRSLDQLRKLSAGLQRDWLDTEIMRANGMNVTTSPTYEGLFQMLAAGRFDYFPRGIGEIWREAELYKELGLVVEQRLALHYPFPNYFFVSPGEPQLAAALSRGLEVLERNGSMARLFDEYNGDSIRRAQTDARRVFELKMPHP